MTTTTDEPDVNELDLTRSQLRAGIETSREMVRQSRVLIALSESDSAPLAGDDRPAAS